VLGRAGGAWLGRSGFPQSPSPRSWYLELRWEALVVSSSLGGYVLTGAGECNAPAATLGRGDDGHEWVLILVSVDIPGGSG